MPKFGEKGYWDQRYIDETHTNSTFKLFDWYTPFDKCYATMVSMIDLSIEHRVLVIGVGKSGAIETLYNNGFRSIIAVDISPTLVRQMQQKYASYSGVEFICCDVRKMAIFPDKSFTLVIDKACLDALFCEFDFMKSVREALTEIHRVMSESGHFACISHASAVSRVCYFRFTDWAIEVIPLPLGCGEGLSCIRTVRTKNCSLIEIICEDKCITSLNQHMNIVSTMKIPSKTGSLTVTESPELLDALIQESAGCEVDLR